MITVIPGQDIGHLQNNIGLFFLNIFAYFKNFTNACK